jgi:hypothetical protein
MVKKLVVPIALRTNLFKRRFMINQARGSRRIGAQNPSQLLRDLAIVFNFNVRVRAERQRMIPVTYTLHPSNVVTCPVACEITIRQALVSNSVSPRKLLSPPRHDNCRQPGPIEGG